MQASTRRSNKKCNLNASLETSAYRNVEFMSSTPSIGRIPTDGETEKISEITSISSTTISNESSAGYDYERLGNFISRSMRSDSVSQGPTKPMLERKIESRF
jgi:hypothetical protein